MTREVRVLRCGDLTHEQRTRWDELLQLQPVKTAFLSAAYACAANATLNDVRICIIREHGREVLFFPFCQPSMRAQVLHAAEPVAGSFSDYVGVIAEPGFRLSPRELLNACRLSSFLFTHLDETQTAFGLSGGGPAKGLRIRSAAGGADFLLDLAQRDRKFFQDTERRMKKLERDRGSVRFALEDPRGETLEWLLDTKVAQYQRTGKTRHPFSKQRDRDFLEHLASQDDPLCKPRLTALYCNEKRIAAHFGLQCASTLAYWFPVYDPEFRSYSPGRLLMWETLKRAPELGIDCVDRGEGDTQAKRDFANEEHFYYRDYYFKPGLTAFADKALNSIAWRLAAAKKQETEN